MNRVYKYALQPGRNDILLAEGSELLTVATQNGVPTLWAKVDVDAPQTELHVVHVVGTGHDLPEFCKLRYIGTAHEVDGWMVFHAFEDVR